MAHMHITAWAVAIILLFIVVSMYGKGKMKPGKIVHMILRLFYLFVIGSGIGLFMEYANYPTNLFIKLFVGLWTIVSIEMIAVGASKRKSVGIWWVQFILAAGIAIYLGFGVLPMGILP
ncbi:MAG TPA: YisL family protein [Bacillota bacterium]|nr:YisL family protein [Bacillota bacterium]